MSWCFFFFFFFSSRRRHTRCGRDWSSDVCSSDLPGARSGSQWPRQGMTGPVGYWNVDDITSTLKALLEAGAEAQQEITDVGGGKLIATVKDADGNVIGLVQAA